MNYKKNFLILLAIVFVILFISKNPFFTFNDVSSLQGDVKATLGLVRDSRIALELQRAGRVTVKILLSDGSTMEIQGDAGYSETTLRLLQGDNAQGRYSNPQTETRLTLKKGANFPVGKDYVAWVEDVSYATGKTILAFSDAPPASKRGSGEYLTLSKPLKVELNNTDPADSLLLHDLTKNLNPLQTILFGETTVVGNGRTKITLVIPELSDVFLDPSRAREYYLGNIFYAENAVTKNKIKIVNAGAPADARQWVNLDITRN